MSFSFSAKDPDETVVVSIDFTQLLDAGESVADAEFTALDRNSMNDASSSILIGDPDLTAAPILRQRVSGGSVGHSYAIRVKVTTSSTPERVLVDGAILPVQNRP